MCLSGELLFLCYLQYNVVKYPSLSSHCSRGSWCSEFLSMMLNMLLSRINQTRPVNICTVCAALGEMKNSMHGSLMGEKMCLISHIMNWALQSYIGFHLMSVCCKKKKKMVHWSETQALLSQKSKYINEKDCGEKLIWKRKCTKYQGGLSLVSVVHLWIPWKQRIVRFNYNIGSFYCLVFCSVGLSVDITPLK